MTGRQYVMQFVAIFIASCPFIAAGLFGVYMMRRERRRQRSQQSR